jgi:hypothetical protein
MAHNLDIEISALRKGWGEWCEDYKKISDESARNELDAKRYRWLRQHYVTADHMATTRMVGVTGSVMVLDGSGADLDQLIDEALQAATKTGQQK